MAGGSAHSVNLRNFSLIARFVDRFMVRVKSWFTRARTSAATKGRGGDAAGAGRMTSSRPPPAYTARFVMKLDTYSTQCHQTGPTHLNAAGRATKPRYSFPCPQRYYPKRRGRYHRHPAAAVAAARRRGESLRTSVRKRRR